MDVDEMPGAIIPAGNYVVEGERVRVTINMLRDEQPAATLSVEGDRRDLPALAETLLEAVAAEAQRLNSITVKLSEQP